MTVTQAMLMAAGLGTRLKPFTDHAPKAFLPVMGVPAAQFALDSAVRAGVSRLVVNVHHHPQQSLREIAALDAQGAELVVSDESRELLGSAGGIKKALPHFGGKPFFLLNADVLCDLDLVALAHAHARLRSQWGVKFTLAVHPQGPAGGKYREIHFDAEEGRIRSIGDLATGRPFFIGAAVMEADAFDLVPDGVSAETVPLIFEPAIREGKAGVFLACGKDDPWKDIGAPSLWLDAHLSLIQGLETGKIPSAWRTRIEQNAHRVAQGIWISRKSATLSNRARATHWSGPCFWSGEKAPQQFGPNSVFYGNIAGSAGPRSNGIGRDGAWVDVAKL